MVYVVVDEPRGKLHYGSEVAGPAALAILREALGFTRDGEEVEQSGPDGFHAVTEAALDAGDQPWAEASPVSERRSTKVRHAAR
jgi:hypothetical protein